MTFHYLNIDSVFYYIVITKQMNRNSYVIPTSCFTSNAYSYYRVHTSSFRITPKKQGFSSNLEINYAYALLGYRLVCNCCVIIVIIIFFSFL